MHEHTHTHTLIRAITVIYAGIVTKSISKISRICNSNVNEFVRNGAMTARDEIFSIFSRKIGIASEIALGQNT